MPRTSSKKPAKSTTETAVVSAPEAPKRGPGRPPKAKSYPLSVYSHSREVVLDFPDEASRANAINQVSKRCPRGLDARISVGGSTYHFVRVDYMKY